MSWSCGATSAWRWSGGRPVTEVIGDRLRADDGRLGRALILTWVLALPIGIYSAVRQYSVGDYVVTFIGFIGLAVPNFLLALVCCTSASSSSTPTSAGCSPPSTRTRRGAWPRSDLLKHLPIPAVILGLAGTAQQIRIMRANLLDELRKPYVVTARAGLSECRVILKYPVRVALNPFASTIGYMLPYVVSGSIIVSLVLSLPTVGPLLLQGADRPGHVPGRHDHPAARRHDGDRHADLGSAPGVDRSAHPPGGD